MKRFLNPGTMVLAVAFAWVTPAMAIPPLQIYIEGATYDDATDDWTIGTGESFRLWVIGNTTSPSGPIQDVKLAFAYNTGLTPSFALTGSTTGGYLGFSDATVASNPVFSQIGADGTIPKLGDGSDLPSHGIYGSGTMWTEYLLGDFTVTTDDFADFNGLTDTPSPTPGLYGQINVYDVTVTGLALGDRIHIDAYNHYFNPDNHGDYVFAPPSHDGGTTLVPEPGTLALLGLGLAGLGAAMRRRRQN